MEFSEAYKKFFTRDEAGKHFVQWLNKAIESGHLQAEANPERARDMTQQALGARQVLNHIELTITPPKKKEVKQKERPKL